MVTCQLKQVEEIYLTNILYDPVMKLILLLVLLAAYPVNAEILTIVCEHDGGIRRSDGLPSDMEINIFAIDINLETQKIVTTRLRDIVRQLSVTEHVINFLVDMENHTRSRRYMINRNTGRLFVNEFGVDDGQFIDIIASGSCQKPNQLF